MPSPFITIAVSEEQRAELEAVLEPQQVRKALFQAVKRTTNAGRTQINRRVREELNITKKYADRAITSKDPKGDEPVGTITISREPIPLVAYRPTFLKRGGVRVRISKNKPPVTYRHAFEAAVRSPQQAAQGLEGHQGVFARSRHLPTKGPNVGGVRTWTYKGKKRRAKIKLTPRGFAGSFAIEEIMGPSVLSVLGEAGTTKVAQEELAKLHDVLQKNLDSQMDRFLERKKGQAADNA